MVGSMALFAMMAVCARVAERQMSAPQLVLVRFAICGAGVGALWAARRVEVRPRNLRLLALRGVLGGAAVLLYFVAIERCRDTGTATLLNLTSPIFTSLLAWVFLRERPSARLGAGVAVAFAGVFLVLRRPGGIAIGWGEAAGIASALLSGAAVTTIRAARAYDDAPTILFAFSIAGAAVALPFAVPAWRVAGPVAWALAVGVGGTSFFAQLGMTHAFGLVSASRGALYQQLTPVFTFALALALLGERLTAGSAAGALLTVGAVAWAGAESAGAPQETRQKPSV